MDFLWKWKNLLKALDKIVSLYFPFQFLSARLDLHPSPAAARPHYHLHLHTLSLWPRTGLPSYFWLWLLELRGCEKWYFWDKRVREDSVVQKTWLRWQLPAWVWLCKCCKSIRLFRSSNKVTVKRKGIGSHHSLELTALVHYLTRCSVQFNRSVVSNPLQPHGLQHTGLPCPSPTPRACSNSCPSSQWCHPTISSSVIPFSSCLQSFPSIRVSSNDTVLHIRWPKYWSFSFSPSNEYSGLISFRMDWLDLLAVQGTLKSLPQHHSSNSSQNQFFGAPLSL